MEVKMIKNVRKMAVYTLAVLLALCLAMGTASLFAVNAEDKSLKIVTVEGHLQDSSNRYIIYFSGETPLYSENNGRVGFSEAEINGKAEALDIWNGGDGTFFFPVSYDIAPKTQENEIKISAGTVIGDYVVSEDVTIITDDSDVYIYREENVNVSEINGFAQISGADNLARYMVLVKFDKELRGREFKYLCNWIVELNGKELTVNVYFYEDYKGILFPINFTDAPYDKKNEITIKADSKVKNFIVSEEVHFVAKGEDVIFNDATMAEGILRRQIEKEGRSGRKMQILAYDGPSLGIHLSEGVLTNNKYRSSVTADIKKYFDAGFNYLVADEADYGAYRYEGIQYGSGISGTKNDAERMLDLVALYCDEYGITDREQAPVIIYWSFIFAIMDKDERQNLMLNGEVRSDDNVKFLLKNAYDELRAYVPAYPEGYTAKTNGTPLNCFRGFVLRDEPFGEDLELYVKWYNYLADDMGMAGNGDLLVGSVLTFGVAEKYAISGSTSENVVSDEDFRTNYLEKVVSGMANNSADKGKQYVMTDPYPFYTTLKKSSWSSGVTASYYISDSYFTTLEEYAEKAKEQGLKAGVALQSTTHYNKSRFEAVGSAGFFSSAECRVTGRVDKSGNLTANENHIRYQAYMATCYGYERIDYFTYWEHFNSIAAETMRQSAVMWSYDQASGEYVAAYQPTYDWIKKANAEIRGFESVILAFDRQGTRLVTGTVASGNCFGNAKGYSGDAIANTATASYDLAVGCFELSEMKGYMLVNADDPSYARTNTVSIDFGTGYAYAVCYVNGMAEVKALSAGKLNISLGAGDGVFAIPVK